MISTLPTPTDEPEIDALASSAHETSDNGLAASLAGMSFSQLQALQWHEEQKSARTIMQLPKGSRERTLAVSRAYDTICTILAAQSDGADQPLVMGLDPRYVRLVLKLLRQQFESGHQPRLFEVGYGSGALLAEVSGYGYAVGGIEVSAIMRAQALERLGKRHSTSLLLGDLRGIGLDMLAGRPTMIYWNDVLEHIPPDEVREYAAHIYQLLVPGGMLVTITPNWLLRPSDVTGDFLPVAHRSSRTAPQGIPFGRGCAPTSAGRLSTRYYADSGDALPADFLRWRRAHSEAIHRTVAGPLTRANSAPPLPRICHEHDNRLEVSRGRIKRQRAPRPHQS